MESCMSIWALKVKSGALPQESVSTATTQTPRRRDDEMQEAKPTPKISFSTLRRKMSKDVVRTERAGRIDKRTISAPMIGSLSHEKPSLEALVGGVPREVKRAPPYASHQFDATRMKSNVSETEVKVEQKGYLENEEPDPNSKLGPSSQLRRVASLNDIEARATTELLSTRVPGFNARQVHKTGVQGSKDDTTSTTTTKVNQPTHTNKKVPLHRRLIEAMKSTVESRQKPSKNCSSENPTMTAEKGASQMGAAPESIIDTNTGSITSVHRNKNPLAVVEISTTPTPEDSKTDQDGTGPSLRAITRTARELLDAAHNDGRIKLDQVQKFIIRGLWEPTSKFHEHNVKKAHTVQSTTAQGDGLRSVSDDEHRLGEDHVAIAIGSAPKLESADTGDPGVTATTAASTTDEKNEGDEGVTSSVWKKQQEILAVAYIVETVSKMTNLKEFYWYTWLPFSKELWAALPVDTLSTLHINLFRPAHESASDDVDHSMLVDMHQLRKFRKLQHLSLVGMLDSYQTKIWEAVWGFPDLGTLELKMSLEPNVRSTHEKDWPMIQGDWKMREPGQVPKSYHGNRGSGLLHYRHGYGEYLDPISILTAKRAAIGDQPDARLPIENLTLAGFVVDSQAFDKCFDMRKMKRLEFAHDCVDAGFTLESEVRARIRIIIPKGAGQHTSNKGRVFKPEDVKLVTLERGRVVKREPVDPAMLRHLRRNP